MTLIKNIDIYINHVKSDNGDDLDKLIKQAEILNIKTIDWLRLFLKHCNKKGPRQFDNATFILSQLIGSPEIFDKQARIEKLIRIVKDKHNEIGWQNYNESVYEIFKEFPELTDFIPSRFWHPRIWTVVSDQSIKSEKVQMIQKCRDLKL